MRELATKSFYVRRFVVHHPYTCIHTHIHIQTHTKDYVITIEKEHLIKKY